MTRLPRIKSKEIIGALQRAGFVVDRTLRANISETVLVPLFAEQGEKEKGRDEHEFS